MEDEGKRLIESLIDEYKDRLRTVSVLLLPLGIEEKKEVRLKTKQGDYRTFVSELQFILNNTKDDSKENVSI